jgi:alpha-L-arabinofuranosidase
MIARHYQPLNLPARVEGGSGRLRVAAARSEDGKTLVLRVVNSGAKPIVTRLDLEGYTAAKAMASVEELSGPLEGRNTAKEPERYTPQKRTWRHEMERGKATYTLPGHSFTVLTFE